MFSSEFCAPYYCQYKSLIHEDLKTTKIMKFSYLSTFSNLSRKSMNEPFLFGILQKSALDFLHNKT